MFELIRSKGEARKNTVFNSARFQTADYENTSKLAAQLGNDKVQVQNERDEYLSQYNLKKQGLQNAKNTYA